MKKILSLILAAVMLSAVLPGVGAFAADVVDSGKCGDNLTWSLTSDGTLTISGTGDMYEYSWENEAPWKDKSDSITSVVIESGVTSIGQDAFSFCSSLSSIIIPDGVTSIGGSAFSGCSSMKSITLPDSVESIGIQAFAVCSNLTSIVIPDSVTIIDAWAFHGCSSMTSIELPDSVTIIGAYAFNYTGLTNITLPDGVEIIGEGAFSECSDLTSITIPNSVKFIGSVVFDDTPYYNDEANWENGVLYINNALITAHDVSGDYSIKDGTVCIADSAFAYCSNLTSITIPDGLASIGYGAFWDCSSLTSITIPDSVTSIELLAFIGCDKLRDVYYSGSKEQWALIEIGDENEPLKNATIHFNADMKDIPTTSEKNGVSFSDVNKNQDFYNAVTYLSEKSILSGYTDGTFRPYGTITRAEAATVMVRMLGLEGSVTQGKTNFTDVPADNWAAGYINAAEEAGIISGMGDGTFEPNGEVTYEQIVKMVVCALGYEPEAMRNGGYPSGYLKVAKSQLGITDGVSGFVGEAASRATVAMILYNAMMINK